MPSVQQGSPYKLKSGGWGIRYYTADGKRVRKSGFKRKSDATDWYRDHIAPARINGKPRVEPLSLAEFVPVFLERHGTTVAPKTKQTLRERLLVAEREFGTVMLTDLQHQVDAVAGWSATLPERSRFAYVAAFRQCLDAAIRWGHIDRNPARDAGPNPQPPPPEIRVFTPDELWVLTGEMPAHFIGLPGFASATGLRPQEWTVLEHRDIDRDKRVIHVRRTLSGGKVKAMGKTARSRRQVPLQQAAIDALDLQPVNGKLVFPTLAGQRLSLNNWRNRVWYPAIDAGGIQRPARVYDMRSTFASNALAAGVPVHTLARIMGTSVKMIERHYGALLEGAGEALAQQLDEFHAAQSAGVKREKENV